MSKIFQFTFLFSCSLWFLFSACNNPRESLKFEIINLPSGDDAVFPNLLNTGSSLYLSWIDESGNGVDKLTLSEWQNDVWGEPEVAATGDNWFINWADFPTIGINDHGDKLVHYLAKSAEGTYDYDVQLAFKGRGSEEWGKIGKPYQDTTKGEHGFVSMFPAPNNQLGIAWLDGRKYATETKEMMLMGNFINTDGTMGKEVILDERVCDCCQTNAARISNGAIVVYRNRSEKEIRDIYRVIYKGGKWSDPAPVANDSWEISGCPVNGPAVDVSGERVAVGWFTNAGDTAKVKVAFSENEGETFAEPLRIDLGNPIGRVDIKFDQSGTAWISWVENVEKEAEIFTRSIAPDGTLSVPFKVSGVNEHRASGFPRLEILGETIYLVWTNSNKPSSLVMVKAKI